MDVHVGEARHDEHARGIKIVLGPWIDRFALHAHNRVAVDENILRLLDLARRHVDDTNIIDSQRLGLY